MQVPVEPALPPSLAALALGRFALVQVESPLAGQCLHRLNHPWWVLLEPMPRSKKPISVEQSPCRSWPGLRQLLMPVEPELQPSLAALELYCFALVLAVPPLAGQR